MKVTAFLLCFIFIKQAYTYTYKQCPAGQYLASCLTRCYNCQRGRYSYGPQGALFRCNICPLGHRCPSTSSPPRPCPRGQYQDRMEQTNCKVCEDGKYSTYEGGIRCNDCPTGHYCPYAQNPPSLCLRGRYQDQKGQTSCKECNTGEYSIEIGRSRKCDICPAGHRCYYKDSSPEKCREGQYQDQMGQTSCKNCKNGHYSLQIGSTKCNICPAGSSCPYPNMKPRPCQKGDYSPAGSVKCFSCPVGGVCSSTAILNGASNTQSNSNT